MCRSRSMSASEYRRLPPPGPLRGPPGPCARRTRSVCGCIPASSAATEITYTARSLETLRGVLGVVRRPRQLTPRWAGASSVFTSAAHTSETAPKCSTAARCSSVSLAGTVTSTVTRRSPATAPAVAGHAAALHPEGLARGRACRDAQGHRVVQSGHRHRRPQRRLGEGDGDGDGQVAPPAPEERVAPHVHDDVEVAGRPVGPAQPPPGPSPGCAGRPRPPAGCAPSPAGLRR